MLERFLPRGSWQRSAALAAAAVAVVLLFTQLALPGKGNDPQGTPAAILFQGFTSGLVTALIAVGVVLVYRTLRIINFAQAAIGAGGAVLVFELLRFTPIPFVISFLIGVLLAGVIGAVVDLALMRRFFTAPRLVVTVLTIAVAGVLGGLIPQSVPRLPIFPPFEGRTPDEVFGPVRPLLPLQGFTFQVGSFPQPFGFPEVFAIWVAVLSFAGIWAFFRFTKAGVAVRALAENSERAALLGISVGSLSTLVWALAGMLSGAGVALNGVMTTPFVAAGIAGEALFVALAAAVLGRMRSIPVTAFAAVLLSVALAAANWSLEDTGGLVVAGLFLVVAVGMLLQRRQGGRSEEGAGVSWQATEEQRPIPAELAQIPTVLWARRGAAVAGLGALLLFPWVTSTGVTNLGAIMALFGIVAVSLVVLTGWAGQVSLGQFAFVAIGAVLGGSLTARVGLSFWLAVPLAAALTAGIAAVVGIPALRLKGLFLAVVTFGFSLAVSATIFDRDLFGWLLPEEVVERPTLFFLDFGDERSMYYLAVAALVLSIVIVTNLRRSRTGRILIAARENEANLQSLGVPLVRTKLVAFAVSGMLCGLAGAIYAHHQQGLNPNTFGAGESISVFLMTVIGGVGSIPGALLGTAWFQGVEYFFSGNLIIAFLQPSLTLLVLYAAPGGVISLLGKLRDSWLRIVAQRRQIVVPSLFADFDPEILERRLIPLADPLPSAGLAALPPGERFTMASELYQGHGVRIIDRLRPVQASKEAAAIGAAQEALAERTPAGATEGTPS